MCKGYLSKADTADQRSTHTQVWAAGGSVSSDGSQASTGLWSQHEVCGSWCASNAGKTHMLVTIQGAAEPTV